MTPAQVEEAARRRYNSDASTFWSQDEVFKVIWEGEMILALEDLVIEGKDTTITTVAGTRAYDFPSLMISAKRIEYNGSKLQPIDFRDDDALSLNNSATTAQGSPQYYAVWNKQIYLRPVPDAAQTLTIYKYSEPTLLTTASTTLSTPTICHQALINYTTAMMAAKDENWTMHDRYMAAFTADRVRINQWFIKKKRQDGFAVVKDEESLASTLLGGI